MGIRNEEGKVTVFLEKSSATDIKPFAKMSASKIADVKTGKEIRLENTGEMPFYIFYFAVNNNEWQPVAENGRKRVEY